MKPGFVQQDLEQSGKVKCMQKSLPKLHQVRWVISAYVGLSRVFTRQQLGNNTQQLSNNTQQFGNNTQLFTLIISFTCNYVYISWKSNSTKF